MLVYIMLQEEKTREKEKGKPRNIDYFMEELKHEQGMRERRNQEREHWRDRHTDNPAVSGSKDIGRVYEIKPFNLPFL